MTRPIIEPPLAGNPTITQRFGENPDYYKRFSYDGVPLRGHNGVDYGVPIGTPVYACDAGTVTEIGIADSDTTGYGNYVKLQHEWGESLYAHLNIRVVDIGYRVDRGQWIGNSGNTGNSTGPHLHFAIRVNPYSRTDGWGGYCDPLSYLQSESPEEAAIRTAARRQPVLAVNPDAALYKAARLHGLPVPAMSFTNEFEVAVGAARYIAQRFGEYIAYCVIGDWGNVKFIAG